jgi:hypothetical protein
MPKAQYFRDDAPLLLGREGGFAKDLSNYFPFLSEVSSLDKVPLNLPIVL